MPTNTIRIERDWVKGELKFEVWDKDGQKQDVTEIFLNLHGIISTSNLTNELTLKIPADSLETKLHFVPDHEERLIRVSSRVIEQILEMKG